uniref:Uncharacterized protein n=1 Tax=Plectus sambesii TaxID=2011161 RepID=A0A914VMG2_9BILA
MNTGLIISAFVCCLFVYGNALQCYTGVEGANEVHKAMYTSLYMCCYKYTDMVFQKYTYFGAVPPGFNNRACSEVGKCFFLKEINKNVCVCANADDANCQPGAASASSTNGSSSAPTNSSRSN